VRVRALLIRVLTISVLMLRRSPWSRWGRRGPPGARRRPGTGRMRVEWRETGRGGREL